MFLITYLKSLIHAVSIEDCPIRYGISDKVGESTIAFCNTGYLLNQTLRQYRVNKSHVHFSKKAINKIYRMHIESFDLTDFLYNANKNIIRENEKTVKFNSIFAIDHVVPINMIINNLVGYAKEGKLTNKIIIKELNKIHLCVLTKEENSDLDKEYRKTREGNYKYILNDENGAYRKSKIVIAGREELKCLRFAKY